MSKLLIPLCFGFRLLALIAREALVINYRLGPVSLNYRIGFLLSLSIENLSQNIKLIFRDGIADSCQVKNVGEVRVEAGVFDFLERDE